MYPGRLVGALFVAVLVAACASDEREAANLSLSGKIIVRNGVVLAPSANALNVMAPAAGIAAPDTAAYNQGHPPVHCSVRDRFDRKDVIAYNFSDGRSRVGLDVDMDGFGLSDLGDIEVEAVTLNFRYRFQPGKKKREKCLFESSWQGLFGSGFNEFFVRETDTVLEALDDEMDEVGDELEKFF